MNIQPFLFGEGWMPVLDGNDTVRGGEGNVLFVMNPTPVDVVRRVCESGEVMPQKSTYFYPKLATGLFINPLA